MQNKLINKIHNFQILYLRNKIKSLENKVNIKLGKKTLIV